jgi:hypothetical protein
VAGAAEPWWSRASVVLVAARVAVRIEPGGWQEFGQPVSGEADLPSVVVDLPVVVPAEQHRVVEVGPAAVCPMVDVVGVAPAGRAVAAGEGAATVAQDESPPE